MGIKDSYKLCIQLYNVQCFKFGNSVDLNVLLKCSLRHDIDIQMKWF